MRQIIKQYKTDMIVIVFFLLVAGSVALAQQSLEIFFVVMTLPISVLFAKYFGDVAGQKAAKDYAEEEAKKARVIAIKSLLNDVQRVRDLAKKNLELVVADRVYNTRGAVRMPVSAFETALVSRESSLLAEARDTPDLTGLLAAIRAYLTEAYSINALVEVRLAAIISHGTGVEQRTGATREVKSKCEGLSETLDRLEECLRRELEKALGMLSTPNQGGAA